MKLILTELFWFHKLGLMSSVILYTVHKAGSTFVNGLLAQICRRLAIEHHTENDARYQMLNSTMSWKQYLESNVRAGCFGPIRAAAKLPIFPDNLDDHSVLLHLRDPRDVVTSMYFSKAYSHRVQSGVFEITAEQREQLREEGIDRFVIRSAQRLRPQYDKLYEELKDRSNVTIVHYEDMVLNFPAWLGQVLSAFEAIRVPAQKARNLLLPQSVRRMGLKHHLIKTNHSAFDISEENVYSHKRKVTPGDHREKLEPATIGELNEIFSGYVPAKAVGAAA